MTPTRQQLEDAARACPSAERVRELAEHIWLYTAGCEACSEAAAALHGYAALLERQEGDVPTVADALRWVLPMARGYAACHPVGRNAEIVTQAEAVLIACHEWAGKSHHE